VSGEIDSAGPHRHSRLAPAGGSASGIRDLSRSVSSRALEGPAALPWRTAPRREGMPGAAPRLGQVQVSPASVVAELNAVVGAAFEAADDDDAISLAVLGDAGLSARCQAACSPLPRAAFARVRAWAQGDSPRRPAVRSGALGDELQALGLSRDPSQAASYKPSTARPGLWPDRCPHDRLPSEECTVTSTPANRAAFRPEENRPPGSAGRSTPTW
jgi:hypothetical protein